MYDEVTTKTAMSFSWICGVLETLGNLPERYFEENAGNILAWAEEYAGKEGDKARFLEGKIKADYREG